MALDNLQSTLLEAVDSMLSGKAKLGLAIHDNKGSIIDKSNTFQYLHENIEQEFRLAVVDCTHHDSLCAAFAKVHSYKYLNDPKFPQALTKEFSAMAIPITECEKAHKAIDRIVNELKEKKSDNWAEKDAGWNPELEAIIGISQPIQIQESLETQNLGGGGRSGRPLTSSAMPPDQPGRARTSSNPATVLDARRVSKPVDHQTQLTAIIRDMEQLTALNNKLFTDADTIAQATQTSTDAATGIIRDLSQEIRDTAHNIKQQLEKLSGKIQKSTG